MSGESILIADADNVSPNYFVSIVKGRRYFAAGTGSGNEGLTVVWRDKPDLIIFDPFPGDIPPKNFYLNYAVTYGEDNNLISKEL